MKTLKTIFSYVIFIFVALCFTELTAQTTYSVYKGKVIDKELKTTLSAVNIGLSNTNISTITNSEGEFLLKVPNQNSKENLIVSHLGYATKILSISSLDKGKMIKVTLHKAIVQLPEVNISAYKNPDDLIKDMLSKRYGSSIKKPAIMTAFYRETIKRRNRNVSLTEALVDIAKQPYYSNKKDIIRLGKARKETDYKRLDTISLKLQGGPFSTLYLDVLKYPEYIFTEETLQSYEFAFKTPSSINNTNVYVVDFKPKKKKLFHINYRGTLYIDAQSLALVSAKYQLDLSNIKDVKRALVRKKPKDVNVIPIKADYWVDYKSTNLAWHYSYSKLFLKFKIKKKKRLFNKTYSLASEMLITDWSLAENIKINKKDRLSPNIIITDAISGFTDIDFWGKHNVIEPDKSIEAAIRKIRNKIKRSKS